MFWIKWRLKYVALKSVFWIKISNEILGLEPNVQNKKKKRKKTEAENPVF